MLRKIQRDIIINAHVCSCKVPVLARFQSSLNFMSIFAKILVSNFVKIRPMGTDLFHAGVRTNGQT